MPTPDEVRAVVDAYVDAYDRNDKQAVLELFRPDAVFHDPVGQPPHVGREGIGAFWDQAHELAESIRLVPSQVVVCANEAAMVFRVETTVGGAAMVVDAVEVFHVDDDGRIRLLKAYWEMESMRPAD